MKTYTRFLLVATLLATAGQSVWTSQMECKLTDANKRICAEKVCTIRPIKALTTSEKLQEEARRCFLSRTPQLRSLLYDRLEQFPLELIDIIVAYDIHLLKGKLQYTMKLAAPGTASIVGLSRSLTPRAIITDPTPAKARYPNVFYARTDSGINYFCNAATSFTYSHANRQKKESDFPEAPKLRRTDAIIHQAIVLPDGSIASIHGSEVRITSPIVNAQSTVLCTFNPQSDDSRSGSVTKLFAVPDGRLATGMSDGRIKLWV